MTTPPKPAFHTRLKTAAGKWLTIRIRETTSARLEVEVDGETFPVRPEDIQERNGKRHVDPDKAVRLHASDHALRAPMPGLVARFFVAPGDQVIVGQPLVLLLAMKMENEILSERQGRIRRLCTAQNKTVQTGDVLLEFE